jgi:rhomboid protease GluP
MQGFRSGDDIIKTIIYVNIAMYLLSLVLFPQSFGLSLNPLTALSPSNKSLFLLGATGTIPIDRLHRWWTLLSANYLHGSLLHIFFNMMVLKQIGPLVLNEYGGSRMVIIYTVSGVMGFLVSYFAGLSFTIGASAAICGMIGSTLYYGKSRGGSYGQAIYGQILGWVIAILAFGFLVPGINNWAHGGGIVAGILLGYVLGYEERIRERFIHKALAGACVLATVLVLLWAVFSGVYFLLSN